MALSASSICSLCLPTGGEFTDPDGPPDLDSDGTVGILDLLTLLANWGPCA